VGLNASNYSVELSHVSVVTGVQFVTVNHKWFVFVAFGVGTDFVVFVDFVVSSISLGGCLGSSLRINFIVFYYL
jgi:hypothetical protein